MFHTIIVVGNVGRDPEMRYTPPAAVTSFSVATSRQYNNSQGSSKETIWFRISAWGKRRKLATSTSKKAAGVGRRPSDADPNTGGPRIWNRRRHPGASFEISAATVRFLSSAARVVNRVVPNRSGRIRRGRK